ncbi:MAG: bile acid:sodium symporter family protein [Saprospiraceae bacterium]|nr:bile acid:sodium symporter family protein [Saprospiraceae bacterium]
MDEIDKVIINFDEGQLFLLNICLGFLMFGVSLELSLKDFKYVLERPKPVLVGMISQLILLPLLTLLLIYLIQPAFTIQLGMLMVAACPGGNISNYMVHRSEGNTALSITMTSIVTLTAVVVTPFSFYLWTQILDAPPDFDRPISVDFFAMVKIIIQLIIVPLILGLVINQRAPKFRALIIKPVKIFSIVLLLGIIAFALAGNQEIIKHHLSAVFLIVLLHNGLAYVLGYYFARINRLPEKDVRAISMETGIQNSGLGLILIFNYFYGLGGMAVLAAWWGVWDIISGFLLSSYWSYRKVDETLEIQG